MTYLKLSEAARQVGVSRPTIYKYAAEGRLSVTKDRLGHKQVQLSELLRVFGELSAQTVKTDSSAASFSSLQQSQKTIETGSLSALLVELERTKAQLESKVVEAALLRERVDELKARERINQEERSRFMAMLEQSQRLLAAPVAPTAPPRAPARKKAAAPVAAAPPPGRNPTKKKAAFTLPTAPAKPAVAAPKAAVSRSKKA